MNCGSIFTKLLLEILKHSVPYHANDRRTAKCNVGWIKTEPFQDSHISRYSYYGLGIWSWHSVISDSTVFQVENAWTNAIVSLEQLKPSPNHFSQQASNFVATWEWLKFKQTRYKTLIAAEGLVTLNSRQNYVVNLS